jgi:hypothetical protein
MVQRTGRHPPEVEVEVRFLLGVLNIPVVQRKGRHSAKVAMEVQFLPGVLPSRCAAGRPAALVRRDGWVRVPPLALRLPVICWPGPRRGLGL